MTNYIKNIASPTNTKTIGGEQFDGQWIFGSGTILASGTSIANGESKTVDISSLLPDNDYDYEIVVEGSVTTSTTSGNQARLYIYPSGDEYSYDLGRAITRASATQIAANLAKMFIKADNQTVRLYNAGNATGSFGCWIHYYRRVGKNGTENNYISNVSIPSIDKTPNVLIFGNPTISNGIVSNFSDDNYLEIINGKQNNNAEYVINFTTPSATVSIQQTIFHSEYFLNLEIDNDTFNIIAHNWTTHTTIALFTATADTTYWVKVIVNEQSKNYYYSTDGETYTQCASFTDADATIDFPSSLRLGKITQIAGYDDWYFRGSINLNRCYINVNGERFWDGMDYIKRLPVGSDNFNGQWLSPATAALGTGISLGVDADKTFDVSSYIPNDGCQYELFLKVQARTGTTSGNNCKLRLGNYGNTQTNPRVCAVVTRTNSYMITGGMAYVILPPNTRTILLENNSNATATNINVYLRGARRIGKNTTTDNYLENIGTSNSIIPFGGDFADGQWVFKQMTAINAVQYNDATSGTTHDYTVTNYLPTDNEWYEILCNSATITGSSSGNYVNLDVKCNPSPTTTLPLGVMSTRTNHTVYTAQNPIIIGRQLDGNMTIRVYNYSTLNVSTGNTYLQLRGYRKLGTNS